VLLPSTPVLLGYAYVHFSFFPNASATVFHELPGGRVIGGVLDGLYANLLSPGRSIILYSPPIVLAFASFPILWRRYRTEFIVFCTLIGSYYFPLSIWAGWSGGWNWGPRFLVPLIPFLLIPTCLMLESRRNVLVFAVLGVIGVLVQLPGLALNYTFVYLDWLSMQLSGGAVYVFVPELSPIPTHLRNILAGTYIDFWLVSVWHAYGPPVAGAIAGSLLAMLLASTCWLARLSRPVVRSSVQS
jgi:hypothetical protein